MFVKCTVLLSLLVAPAYSDVSHLFKNAYNTYQSALNTINSGYYYDPPPTPTSARPIAPTAPFVPEIIINKKTPLVASEFTFVHPDLTRNVYLPPVADPAIDFPPPSAYLPPAPDVPPQHDPPVDSYLPPAPDVPAQHDPPADAYLPPQMDEFGGYEYAVPSARGLKEFDLFRAVKHAPLQLELNDLRCLNGRSGYFKANIVVQSFIENLPIVDTDVQDPRCRIDLVRTKFVLNLPSTDFNRCGIYSCSEQELCLKIRFPQIGGMKSIGDAILTLQCKIQEKTVSKTHSLRFGVNNFK